MGVFSNKIQRDTLKSGDHIYTWRKAYLYSHHGIYAGEGKVIHFTRAPGQEIGTGTFLDNFIFSSSGLTDRAKSLCPECGDQSNLSGVISSCLDCFLWDGELYLFEYKVSTAFFLAKVRGGTCTFASSDPSEDVLYRASFLLENGFGGYNTLKNNCEDFAIYCKTGLIVRTDISVGRSGQATSFVAVVDAFASFPIRFLTTSCSGMAVVQCGMYCVSRLSSDIGVRRDAIKVPVELVSRWKETGTPTEIEAASSCELDQVTERPETETPILGLVSCCDLDQPAVTETDKLLVVSSCDLDQTVEIKAVSSCELDQVAERPETETPILGLVSCCDLDQPAVTETDKLLVVSSCDLDQTVEIKAVSSCELDQVAERPETETPILGLVSCCDLDQPAVTETDKLLVVSSCDLDQTVEIKAVSSCELDQVAERPETETPILGLVSCCDLDQPAVTETDKLLVVSSCDLDQTAEIKAASSCELDQVAERPETETPILGLVSCCNLDQPAVTETAKLLVVSSCIVGQQDEIEKANLGLDGSCEVDQPGEAATANSGPVSSCDLDKQVDTPTPTPNC